MKWVHRIWRALFATHDISRRVKSRPAGPPNPECFP
nr:MAG TPA: hypothetical protein [Caudoviricetes sp.]